MLSETAISKIGTLPKNSIVIKVTRSENHVLSPSWKVLNQYKKDGDWGRYVVSFREEMQKPECIDEMKRIINLAKENDVYLACFETEGNCHRFLLLEWMQLIRASRYFFWRIR